MGIFDIPPMSRYILRCICLLCGIALEHKVELLTQQMEYIKKAIVLGRKEQ